MAVIKAVKHSKTGHPKSLSESIAYASKELKQEGKEHLCAGIDCPSDPKQAYNQMMATKNMFDKLDGRQYKHYIQSFAPGEISAEKALEIAQKLFAEKFKNHEIFLAVHTDKKHIHVHAIVNSVNFVNGMKLHLPEQHLEQLKERSDEICKENGLSVIVKDQKREDGKFRNYNMAEKQLHNQGQSYADKISESILTALKESRGKGIEIFKESLSKQGITADFGRSKDDISFSIVNTKSDAKTRKKNTRASSLAKKLGDPTFIKENILAIVNQNEDINKKIHLDVKKMEGKENVQNGTIQFKPRVKQPSSRGSSENSMQNLHQLDVVADTKDSNLLLPSNIEGIMGRQNESGSDRLRRVADQSEIADKQPKKNIEPVKNYHEYVYKKLEKKYSAQGYKNEDLDKKIYLDMARNFKPENIRKAITTYSNSVPDESGKAKVYLDKIAKEIDKSYNDIKNGKVKFGGGIERDRGGSSKFRLADRTDYMLKDFLDARGAVAMRANIYRDDDDEEYKDMLSQGVDPDVN